jgi:ABC-2 type transport system ATP-binding protein/ribosome-dependent ATPase
MKPVVARNVSRAFGTFIAVDRVDLDVDAGEVVGLVGANGAGKTTLIRMLLGLLEPTDGQIRLFGGRQTRLQRRRVGYVPQNLGLYRDLTARENLEFRAEVFSGRVAPDAPPNGDLVGELPLGLQRRIAFLAATQHDPELLILDEPTSGVSPLARAELWDMIRIRAEAGAAVLVSTHYMDEAEQADRLVLMSQGRVAARGSLADIVGDRIAVEVTADRWSDAFAVLDRLDRKIALAGRTVRVLDEPADAVAGELRRAGIDADVRVVPATLDETMVVIGT